METLPKTRDLTIDFAYMTDSVFTYLEKNGIYHLDTHPGNVYITTGNKLAIIDFDESRMYELRMYKEGLPIPTNNKENGFPKGVFITNSQFSKEQRRIFDNWLFNRNDIFDDHYKFGGKHKNTKTQKKKNTKTQKKKNTKTQKKKNTKTQKPKKKYQI
jgi:hypothetical protein